MTNLMKKMSLLGEVASLSIDTTPVAGARPPSSMSWIASGSGGENRVLDEERTPGGTVSKSPTLGADNREPVEKEPSPGATEIPKDAADSSRSSRSELLSYLVDWNEPDRKEVASVRRRVFSLTPELLDLR